MISQEQFIKWSVDLKHRISYHVDTEGLFSYGISWKCGPHSPFPDDWEVTEMAFLIDGESMESQYEQENKKIASKVFKKLCSLSDIGILAHIGVTYKEPFERLPPSKKWCRVSLIYSTK